MAVRRQAGRRGAATVRDVAAAAGVSVETRIHGQLGGLLAVLAESGAEVEEIARTAEAERRAVLGGIVDRLAGMGFLADGLGQVPAADAYWAVSAASLYVRLVHDRCWTPEQYTAWLLAPGGSVLTETPTSAGDRWQHVESATNWSTTGRIG